MSLSRLQLAAALLEYDNLENTSRPPISHRDSALFKPFQPRPLDHIPLTQPSHPSHPSHRTQSDERPQSSFSNHPQYRDQRESYREDHQAGPSRRVDRSSSFRPESSYSQYGRSSQDIERIEAHRKEVENVDLDRWDLPEHLVSPTTSLPTPTIRSSRPLSTTFPSRPLTTSTLSFPDDQPPSRQLPPLRTTTAGLTPQPITSPLSDRINSVHLDVLDGIPREEGAGGDVYDEANEAIERSRRIQSLYSDTGMARRTSIDDLGRGNTIPTMVPLPPSPASTLMSFRPTSGMAIHGEPTSGMSGANHRPGSVTSRGSLEALRSPSVYSTMRPGSRMSSFDPTRQGQSRQGIHETEEMMEEEEEPNPFAIPAPPIEIGSRFDPKVLEAQRKSIDLTRPISRFSRLSISSQDRLRFDTGDTAVDARRQSGVPSRLTEEHLHAHLAQPGYPSTTLKSHPLEQPDILHGREIKIYDDIPTAEAYGKPLRPAKYGPTGPIDRRSLLRPKTLIMPQPLSHIPPPVSPPKNIPEGYVLGDKPLPPGSRSSILQPDFERFNGGGAGGGRPGLPLSLSQKTFRSSLVVGGKREEEYWVGGATEDGQVGVEFAGDWEMEGPTDRRPGKLYGRSLMDQLEARKAAMKGKQRVFTGDNRPTMMARQDPQQAEVQDPSPSTSTRPLSQAPIATRQPLLKIDSSGEIDLNPLNPNTAGISPEKDKVQSRMTKSRSVFGVDTIWEKEMGKLKVIQEAEQRARERAEAQKEAQDALEGKKRKERQDKKDKKRKGKGKEKAGNGYEALDPNGAEHESGAGGGEMIEMSPLPVVDDLPPQISYSPEKAPPPQVVDPITDEVKDVRDVKDLDLREEYREEEEDWSGDEETPLKRAKGKQRDSGISRHRIPKESPTKGAQGATDAHRGVEGGESDADSEEDVPLSKMVKPRPAPAPTAIATGPGKVDTSDSEEDVPLSKMKSTKLPSMKGALSAGLLTLPSSNGFGTGSLGLVKDLGTATLGSKQGGNESDEDDVPLMLRKSRHVSGLIGMNGINGIAGASARSRTSTIQPTGSIDPDVEDDLPLGFKHAEAVVKQHTGQWGGTNGVMSPNPYGQSAPGQPGYGHGYSQSMYGMPGMPGMPGMAGMPGLQMYGGMQGSMSVYNPYGGSWGMQGYGMGYPQGQMGWSAMGGQMGIPGVMGQGGQGGMTVAMGTGMGMGLGGQGMIPVPVPVEASKNIDSWRKEVAIQPVPTGGGSVKSGGAR